MTYNSCFFNVCAINEDWAKLQLRNVSNRHKWKLLLPYLEIFFFLLLLLHYTK